MTTSDTGASDPTKGTPPATTPASPDKRGGTIEQLDAILAEKRRTGIVPSTVGIEKPKVDTTAGTGETPPAVPPTADTPDLSHIPEQYRDAFKNLPPEAVKWSEGALLRQSDYTRKTQGLSEDRKKFEASKTATEEAAANWMRLSKSPNAMKAAWDAMEQSGAPAGGPPTDQVVGGVFDYPNATPDQVEAHIQMTAEQIAQRIVERHLDQRLFKPLSEKQARIAAASEYGSEAGYTDDELGNAIRTADSWSKSIGGPGWDGVASDKAVDFFKPFLAKKTPTVASMTVPGVRVAAPSNGAGVMPPEALPKHLREGRLPKDDAERLAHAAYNLSRRLGVSISPDSIARAQR